MIALFSGLTAGMLHVFYGPDHLAAVAPLSLRNWKKAATLGFHWGIGHSSGVLFVGLLVLLFREFIPVDAISSWGERLVGVVLIGIGLWGIRKSLKAHVHVHEHSHDGQTHVHYHLHTQGHDTDQAPEKSHQQHTHAAFAIGTLHGVAGSSHFLGVLPALLFPDRIASISFLVAFGVGTVLAMILFSSLFGWLGWGLQFKVRYYKFAGASVSSAAVALGMYWLAKA